MNRTVLLGRLTRDPEIRTLQDQTSLCRFTVAVDRRGQKAGTERQADFVPCVAWRKTAELMHQHFRKGQRILVTGSLQTRSWEGQDGKRQFAMDLHVEEFEFVDPRPKESQPEADSRLVNPDDFFGEAGESSGLPFDY